MSEQLQIPAFIARAIQAQGRVPLEAVQTKVNELESTAWRARIAAGEPTLEDALSSRHLFARFIAPFAEEIP